MKENFKEKNNEFFRQLLFIGLLIAVGVLIFKNLGYLLSGVLGAVTIYMVLRNSLFYLTEQKRWKPWIAALVLVIVTIIILSGIFFVIFEIIAAQIPSLDTSTIVDDLLNMANRINEFLGFSLISRNLILESRGFIGNLASGLVNTTYNFAINIFIMLFVLYFMLAKGRKFENNILRYFPFKGKSLSMIKIELKNMIYSNAIGIPVIMFAQALASGIGYWIAGLDRIVFWAFLTGIFGLVPIIGTAAVWIPLSIYLFTLGHIWQAIFLAVYSIIIVTNTDNVCRMVLLKVMADTHPLIVLFGVIMGIPLFGFWGIIFGPLLISGFLLLIKIYGMEYQDIDFECYKVPERRKKKKL